MGYLRHPSSQPGRPLTVREMYTLAYSRLRLAKRRNVGLLAGSELETAILEDNDVWLSVVGALFGKPYRAAQASLRGDGIRITGRRPAPYPTEPPYVSQWAPAAQNKWHGMY